jgi:hypothetical protein
VPSRVAPAFVATCREEVADDGVGEVTGLATETTAGLKDGVTPAGQNPYGASLTDPEKPPDAATVTVWTDVEPRATDTEAGVAVTVKEPSSAYVTVRLADTERLVFPLVPVIVSP